MNSFQPDKPVFLFDLAGRSYRFASEEEISAHRVNARTCSGVAAARGQAPAEIAQLRPEREQAEVSGRHLDPHSEFYHTTWEWGDLEFDGQDGLKGNFFCCHAHYSPVDARAFYDPTCDVLAIDADDGGTATGEFTLTR